MLLPESMHTTALLRQTLRIWRSSGAVWALQPCFGFRHPVGGASAMFSLSAVKSCMQEYCRLSGPTLPWDTMLIVMGEDPYFLNLVLGRSFKIRHLMHCHATPFLPEAWLEYLGQQSRWKRSHLGDRADLLFRRMQAWRGLSMVTVGVFVYRTIEDLEGMVLYAKTKKRCAVVGEGRLGSRGCQRHGDSCLGVGALLDAQPAGRGKRQHSAGTDH